MENLLPMYGDIKTIRVHNYINHNTTLNDLWFRTLEHNSFQTYWKLLESKTFNNHYVIYQLISEYNSKYIFVKMKRSTLF